MLATGVFVASLAGMELFAYLMHRFVMHGPMWFLHESHHRPRAGAFEKNDLFGIVFSVPAIVLIVFGTHGRPLLLAAGLGMTAYGFLYWGFHDVIVHGRLGRRVPVGGGYLGRIVKAHLVHHKTTTRQGAVSFGFLYAPRPDRA